MLYESACGPVAVLVFKTGERGDEPRWWVRLPRALATRCTGNPQSIIAYSLFTIIMHISLTVAVFADASRSSAMRLHAPRHLPSLRFLRYVQHRCYLPSVTLRRARPIRVRADHRAEDRHLGVPAVLSDPLPQSSRHPHRSRRSGSGTPAALSPSSPGRA